MKNIKVLLKSILWAVICSELGAIIGYGIVSIKDMTALSQFIIIAGVGFISLVIAIYLELKKDQPTNK